MGNVNKTWITKNSFNYWVFILLIFLFGDTVACLLSSRWDLWLLFVGISLSFLLFTGFLIFLWDCSKKYGAHD